MLLFLILSVVDAMNHPEPMGLVVHLFRPERVAPRNAGIQPLLIRVESAGTGPAHLYVDSRLVAWEDFDGVLRKEIRLRPLDWPVYLEGDPNMEWRWAVKAMDTVRGAHGEVTLLTPRPLQRH